MSRVDPSLAARLHQRANAARWHLSVAEFAAALERSAAKSVGSTGPRSGARWMGCTWTTSRSPAPASVATMRRGNTLFASTGRCSTARGRPLPASTDASWPIPSTPSSSDCGSVTGRGNRSSATSTGAAALAHGFARSWRSGTSTRFAAISASIHCPTKKTLPRWWPTRPGRMLKPGGRRRSSATRSAGPWCGCPRATVSGWLGISGRHDARPDRTPLPGARGHGIAPPDADAEGIACGCRSSAPARGTRRQRDRRVPRGGRGDPGDADLSSLLPVEDVRKNTVDIRSKVEERS